LDMRRRMRFFFSTASEVPFCSLKAFSKYCFDVMALFC